MNLVHLRIFLFFRVDTRKLDPMKKVANSILPDTKQKSNSAFIDVNKQPKNKNDITSEDNKN